jgi:hypothetical protein
MATRFELYYGEPGSGKTRSILKLIEDFLATHPEKTVRVYTGDGSRLMYDLSGLVAKGRVFVMDFTIRDWPFTVCQQITSGYWPKDNAIDNPTAPLVPLSAEDFKSTGMWIFEGTSVMSNYLLGNMKGGLAQRAAAGEQIGEKANVMIKDDGGAAFGGNAPAHYGMAQRHMLTYILQSKRLPGSYVVWTGHERVDDGEKGGYKDAAKYVIGEKIIGPEVAGKAMTSNISREFGNTLHFTVASKREQGDKDTLTGKQPGKSTTEYRIYTRDHFDPDGIVGLKYRAVNRAYYPEHVKDYYVSSAQAPGEGLLQFYRDLSREMEGNKTKPSGV